MTSDELALVIAGTREDWPGGARPLTRARVSGSGTEVTIGCIPVAAVAPVRRRLTIETPRGVRRHGTNVPGSQFMLRLALALLLLLTAAPARAQPVDSFRELEELVEIGRNVVVVTAPDGDVIAGSLLDISPTSLSIAAVDGRRLDLDEMRVRRVQQDWDDSILDGTALGAVVGAAPAMLAAFIGTGTGDPNLGGMVIMPAIVGAAIGAVLDISHTDRTQDLYRSGRGRGIALVISW